ncbi:NAD(P)H-dependent glycerol-3-phosphate dehydrogenase [Paenibacillus chitinolyticus]|uniref:Glycerol-3-phosphate dehydrogenase [NAD(P)+] n=1 Tax=Paenibacillus chitinolyticus TaxID=79263 RepID=A0A410WV83_9BACL|nr:NAD(P)H-dependent glycerol-3-phosphate dehydrogenase [Paenibacillus chitinolyticus]MCY9589385.1 NAD(P)H-dependent glycerol-3-phosphate dehydrogenase [Paenibacillus chitinolyticus]MCY9594458.1 NAD(P)H-dependent glycerol-3-phosphate dehydrogenase [Paenibacillus chitinolyticus]QAV18295.1 NAD(P)H-dependent glycerol-3-phosphate dehydrogenase [Paenibacillus chitinolyticus]
MTKHVSVLVAGSWGTALASVLAANDLDVTIWTRNAGQAEEINTLHTNSRYLQDIALSPRIRATTSIREAVENKDAVVFVVPSAGMREVASQVREFLSPDTLVIHATKGFESLTLKRMTTVLAEELPQCDPGRIVVLSGPSHAEEVIRECPTTVVVASPTIEAAEAAQDLFINSYFRVYTNPDVTGVEVGGALKNIIALGAGLSDGLRFGDNAKAALLTRGLAEIARLGAEMGANPMTFAGLAGIGDLVVTCTSTHSRNWKAGYLLGQGEPLDQVLDKMGMVVEGVKTTKSAYALAQEYGVTMPITSELHHVLFEGKTPRAAVEDLMGRGRTHEIEEVANQTDKWIL